MLLHIPAKLWISLSLLRWQTIRLHEFIHTVLRISSGKSDAIVKLHALVQEKRDVFAVFRDLPSFGQITDDLSTMVGVLVDQRIIEVSHRLGQD